MAFDESKDGGPAFPTHQLVDVYRNEGYVQEVVRLYGMSLRDYFATRAPRKPQPWFQPVMPPRPAAEWDHEHPSHDCFECTPTNWKEQGAWDIERKKQVLVQWPYAWADAQLAERKKT